MRPTTAPLAIRRVAHSTTFLPPHARPFISLPRPPPQILTTTRTLPYTPEKLFTIIADVDSYARFVPHCSSSRVTHWTAPDAQGQRWPTQATLRVGWGGFEESFTSRLRCLPSRLVEAISGESAGFAAKADGGVFKSLLTSWQLRPLTGANAQRPSTEVHLRIEFQFANPLYTAVSMAVSDKVAVTMIDAFETHAKKVLGTKPIM